MAVNQTRVQFVYGIGESLVPLPPDPIISNHAPSTSDYAKLGTIWIDTSTNAPYWLTSIVAGSANWVGTASGSGTFTAITVDPGDITVTTGNVDIDSGGLSVAGNADISGDLTVDGTTTLNGDIDITSAQLIDFTSTLDAAPSILLEANGGTSEQIEIYSNQGTAVNSVYIHSDDGGLTLESTGLASADAVNIVALIGGVDIDGALQVNIASSQNAANAVSINASAGGIDIVSAGSAGEDIDINASSSINIVSTEAVADAVTILASHASGGVTIDAGTGGIEIGNTATCSPIDIGDFVPTSSRLITIGGGTVTTAVTDRVDIGVDGVSTNASAAKQVDVASGNVLLGSSVVNINSGTAASGTSTLNLSTGTGGGTKAVNLGNADALTTFNIDAITLINDSVNANVSVCTGTSTGVVAIGNAAAGAVTVDSGAGISLDGGANSNFSVAGAGIDVTIASAAGQAILSAGEAAANAIRIVASDAAGGIDVDCGTAGATLDSTGAISIDAAASSNFSVSGAGIDLTLASAGGQLIMNAEEAAANALRMLSAAGGLDANVALQMNLDSSQAAADAIRIFASNAAGGIDVDYGTGGMTVTGANGAFTVATGTGAINISADAAATTVNVATGAAVKTVSLGSNNGASATIVQSGTGALALSSGTGTRGLVTVDPAVATEAAGASSTVNSRLIRVIFQGITTASGADEDITINSSLITTSSAILASIATIGGGNDADLTIEGVRQSAGSVVLHCINSGPAAVNTNVLVTVWVLT